MEHPEHGPSCYLCNLLPTAGAVVAFEPVDLYRRRVYLEPLGLQLQLFTGTIATVRFDPAARTVTLTFGTATGDGYPYGARRLEVSKLASSRPGSRFTTPFPEVRGAFEIPASVPNVTVTYSLAAGSG